MREQLGTIGEQSRRSISERALAPRHRGPWIPPERLRAAACPLSYIPSSIFRQSHCHSVLAPGIKAEFRRCGKAEGNRFLSVSPERRDRKKKERKRNRSWRCIIGPADWMFGIFLIKTDAYAVFPNLLHCAPLGSVSRVRGCFTNATSKRTRVAPTKRLAAAPFEGGYSSEETRESFAKLFVKLFYADWFNFYALPALLFITELYCSSPYFFLF